MTKRIVALVLAAILALSLVACQKNNTSTGEATTDPLTKDDVIQVYVSSSPTWPYKEDWKVWEYIKESVGATVEVTAVPDAELQTKWALLFSSPDLLPDVMYEYRTNCMARGYEGAAVALDTLEAYMPNYVEWRDGLTDEEYTTWIAPNIAADGHIYSAPKSGYERGGASRAWLYRKDIFDKHNLETPKTFDELYEVSKKLKEIYPDSYPFSLRSGLSNMGITGPSWNGYWEPTVYYDFDTETWKYGATEDTMLEVIKFYKKMVDEKLTPPNFISISINEWQELVYSDRGFMFPDFMTRIDNFNTIMKTSNPEFNLTAMVPPVADEEKGMARVARNNMDTTSMLLCNSRDERRIANAAKYLDWFYTDEAVELTAWGKEGETYEVVDGKKQYITDENNSIPKVLFGIGSSGTALRADPDAIDAIDSPELAAVKPMILEHDMEEYNPTMILALSDAEKQSLADVNVAVNNYMQEMVTKMILGQEPLSKFDEFKETLVELGINDIIAVYESAYQRIK